MRSTVVGTVPLVTLLCLAGIVAAPSMALAADEQEEAELGEVRETGGYLKADAVFDFDGTLDENPLGGPESRERRVGHGLPLATDGQVRLLDRTLGD